MRVRVWRSVLSTPAGKRWSKCDAIPPSGRRASAMLIEIPGLRSWRVAAFPLIWFYFERADCIDVVSLLGERQDILSIFGEEGALSDLLDGVRPRLWRVRVS